MAGSSELEPPSRARGSCERRQKTHIHVKARRTPSWRPTLPHLPLARLSSDSGPRGSVFELSVLQIPQGGRGLEKSEKSADTGASSARTALAEPSHGCEPFGVSSIGGLLALLALQSEDSQCKAINQKHYSFKQKKGPSIAAKPLIYMVAMRGFEPRTPAL